MPSGQICGASGFSASSGSSTNGSDFVVDRDQLQRFFGDVPIDRRDGGHRLADEAHRIVERVAPLLGDLLDLVVVLPPPAIEPAPQTTVQFSCVTTAFTPGSASAFEASILRMRACGCGLRSTRAYSMPGSWTSPV